MMQDECPEGPIAVASLAGETQGVEPGTDDSEQHGTGQFAGDSSGEGKELTSQFIRCRVSFQVNATCVSLQVNAHYIHPSAGQ